MRPPEFSFRTRSRNLQRLAREAYDVLIIGGGITGAGIARDATLRGLRVALVERRDFAVGTSSRSSKLIHGGVRYLQQGDVGLVMEAAHERRALRALAPHLARPVHMLVPVHTRASYAKLSVGLWTYDRVARVLDEERYEMLDRKQTLAAEPSLRPEGVYGAGTYYEYLTDDARLVLENIKSAAALDAAIVNYAEVTSLVSEHGRLTAAVVRDALNGDELTIAAKVIVNAAGPWVDAVRILESDSERPRLHLTKGIHLVLRRERLAVSRIVVMNTPDRRAAFVVPRGDVVYMGTTDTDYDGCYDDPRITLDDARYLLGAANATFDVDPLTPGDVVGAWAGLRPLLHQEGKKPTEISRKDDIMVGPTGLISIAGGKLTTYRKMAERAMDMVAERLSASGERPPTRLGESERALLSGGDTGPDVEAFVGRLQQKWAQVPGEVVARLVPLYGSNAERMIEAMAGDPQLAQRCAPDAAVTRGEVAYAVRDEMAVTLHDFLERRARLLLWDVDNGLTVAPDVARIMGDLLGWDARRIDSEIEEYRRHVREVKTFTPELEAVAAHVAHA